MRREVTSRVEHDVQLVIQPKRVRHRHSRPPEAEGFNLTRVLSNSIENPIYPKAKLSRAKRSPAKPSKKSKAGQIPAKWRGEAGASLLFPGHFSLTLPLVSRPTNKFTYFADLFEDRFAGGGPYQGSAAGVIGVDEGLDFGNEVFGADE